MGRIYTQKISSYQKDIAKAWELFNCDIDIDESKVSRTVLDSWSRSREFAVNAKLDKAPNLIQKCPIYDVHADLRKAALPIIKGSRKILDDNQLFLLLASAEGTIIEREGNAKTLMLADTQDLIVGSTWTEESIGTNAVGTALSLKRPVQIVAQEHYCEIVKVWGCAAVPIKDLRDGRVLGVLDTTGPEHSFLSMNLGWVNSMASCIELRLNDEKNQEKNQLMGSCMDQLNRWVNDKVMVFDNEGFVVWMSPEVGTGKTLPLLLQNVKVGRRVEELSLMKIEKNSLPSDIKNDWLEAVVSNHKTIGHILIVSQKQKLKTKKPVSPNMQINRNESDTLLIGGSHEMSELRKLAKKLAKYNGIITITGRTGTGKEVFSKEIHNLSECSGNFVAINCGAIQKDLLASELFGYAEGSFSGAKRGGMVGKFEAAKNGTILLDEFCELPLDMQVYLLRVLEEREVVRIGESTPRTINARVLVATNKNLEEEVEAKTLREDLYYRVNATVVNLPELREHKEDIPFLFNYFMDKVARENSGVSPDVGKCFFEALSKYRWPGNVRELKNFAENCFLMNSGAKLTLDNIPKRMRENIVHVDAKELIANVGSLRDIESKLIRETLEVFNGNVSKAAEHLGIARSTFYKKVKGNAS
ncbi:MAG: sigma-54-dependent Fis family transcriptional regulator [Alphaproteobacteria bacterium]|nr:sigma-54-dependent Fis family transcriptional regulator [Alphaproteobacteria bacterium]